MAVEEDNDPSSTILTARNLILLLALAFPIMSLLNNQLLRSKPFLWWLRTPTKMEERVKDGDGDGDGEDFDCVICLSEVSTGEKFRVLPKCKHKFHGGCIDAWLETGKWSCPVCRSYVAAPATDRRNGGEGRSSGDGVGDWISLAVDKICSRVFGSAIMVALSYQECYFYFDE